MYKPKTKTVPTTNLDGYTLSVNKENHGGTLSVSMKILPRKQAIPVYTAILVSFHILLCVLVPNAIVFCGLILLLSTFCYQCFTFIHEETLLVVKSLGYQITTKYIVGQSCLFIPFDNVQKVFINEVLLRHKVIYMLTLLVNDVNQSKSSEKLIPVFMGTKPRLNCLKTIYKHIFNFHR